MMRAIGATVGPVAVILGASAWLAIAQESALPNSARLVVAIRYLQVSGTSHSHLFLYSGTGKLLRQLTKAALGQDRDPVFSPDGKLVILRRESNGKNDFWSVAVDGGKTQHVSAVPSWYFTALKRRLAVFDFPPAVPTRGDPKELRIKDAATPADIHYLAPDDAVELVLKLRDDANPAHDFFPKEPWLREKEKPDIRVSKLAFTSFEQSGSKEENEIRNGTPANEHYEMGPEVGDLDGVMVYQGSPFAWVPPLRAAILRQHRGSTFGEGYFALDLNTRTLHEIAPTGGHIITLEGVPGFFCVTSERYLPLGDAKRTVNCSYLDLWNAQLQRTRFCELRVAQFYGASLYQVSPDEENVVFLPGEREWP